VPAPGAAESFAYYGLLLTLAIMGERRLRAKALPELPRGRSYVPPVVLCSAVLFASSLLRVYIPWPEVTFISVSQADCALVRYRTTTILVDTGTPAAFKSSVSRFLRRLGVFGVDLCVLSHLHEDHSGGFAALQSETPADSVLTSPGSGMDVEALLTPSVEVPRIIEAEPGASYRVGGLAITVLCSLNPSLEKGDENDRSIVLLVGVFGEDAPIMEFWGDAPQEAIADYMSRYPSLFPVSGQTRVIKVPHHGSRDALAPAFYSRLFGSVAVISVGTNSYGHPSKEVLDAAGENAVRLFRTDLRGAVTASFLPFGAIFRSFR
jgi:competence protein ComEC